MENQIIKEVWLQIAGLGRDCGDVLTVGRFYSLLVIVAMLTMLCPGLVTSAVAICGIPDDGLAHTPPEYTSMVPPPKGQTYMDPAYGCVVKRITDGPTDFATAAHHEYSLMSPFNQDNTLILIFLGYGFVYIADTIDGSIVVEPEGPNGLLINTLWEPRWSRTDPNVFYYHEGNQLKMLQLDRTTNPPGITRTVLRTFNQPPHNFSAITFCGGSSDLSEDGDHIAICGDDRTVFAYQISTDTANTPRIFPAAVCDAHVTPNNNVIVERCGWWEFYDINMNFIRQILDYAPHMDVGRDTNGDEIMVVSAAADDPGKKACEKSGVQTVCLTDSTRRCLLELDWGLGEHFSISPNGWVLVSNTDADPVRGTANPPPTLLPTWESSWGPYFNELTLMKVDGSNKMRLAHHRSRRWDGYWHQPRAALSMDGQFLVFDSNFAVGPPPPDYTDVYLIDLRPLP